MHYKPHEAEWNNLTRGNKMTSTVHLQRWAIVYAVKNATTAKGFVQTLFKVARPMGFIVEEPRWLVT